MKTMMRWVVGAECVGCWRGWECGDRLLLQSAAAYVDENPKPPAVLKLDGLEGIRARAGWGRAADGEVALFSEDGHALVASAVTDKDGKFRFKVDKGLYRVVARVRVVPANVPVKVRARCWPSTSW